MAEVMKTVKNDRVLTRNPKRRVGASAVGVVDGKGDVDEITTGGCVEDMAVNFWTLWVFSGTAGCTKTSLAATRVA